MTSSAISEIVIAMDRAADACTNPFDPGAGMETHLPDHPRFGAVSELVKASPHGARHAM